MLFRQVFTEWPSKLRLPPGAIADLPMPVLAIWGDQDPYYLGWTPRGITTMVVPGAGHHSYREKPSPVAIAIGRLARTDSIHRGGPSRRERTVPRGLFYKRRIAHS